VREFELVRLIQEAAGPGGSGVRCGIGDDAAVLAIPPGKELVVTTDTLHEGVHFPADTAPADIGFKSLAVNLSDLAAMGAEPRWVLLSLSIPEGDAAWVGAFIQGFLELAATSGVRLVGGDTCAGPLTVGVTAMGLVDPGQILTRGGAHAGDLVVVSGVPGMAGLALRQLLAGGASDPEWARTLTRPVPRIALGAALVGKATACIDISDGLLADLGHITVASRCGADLELDRLPVRGPLSGMADADRWRIQLASGDDYELCFTLPPDQVQSISELAADSGTELTVIGCISDRPGVRCRTPTGGIFDAGPAGHEHFA
jgi:thiamine-monophosphate kinase